MRCIAELYSLSLVEPFAFQTIRMPWMVLRLPTTPNSILLLSCPPFRLPPEIAYFGRAHSRSATTPRHNPTARMPFLSYIPLPTFHQCLAQFRHAEASFDVRLSRHYCAALCLTHGLQARISLHKRVERCKPK